MPRNIDFTKQPAEVRLAAHAIGLDHKRPYQRHGMFFYRPYRNYFTTHSKACDYAAWMNLCEKNYAKCEHAWKNGDVLFCLTHAGMGWLGATLGIAIQKKNTAK